MTQMRDRIRFWWRRNDREADACDSGCGNRQCCDGDQRQIGFPELLEVLGQAEDEFTAVCHRTAYGGVFSSSVLEVPLRIYRRDRAEVQQPGPVGTIALASAPHRVYFCRCGSIT
jgi:hypothetical protein